MADQPTTVNGIGLSLTLDTSQFDSALSRAQRRLSSFSGGGAAQVTVPTRRAGAVAAYLPGAGGGPAGNVRAQFTVTPTLTAGSTTAFRSQLRRDLAAQPIPISVTLGRSRFAQMRRDITDSIGAVPINVTLGGGKGGTLDVVTAIVARASGLSKSGALAQIRQSMAAIGADPRALESRATGGPISSRKPYLTGEKGPEIVQTHWSGSVIPADEVRRIRRETSLLVQEQKRLGEAEWVARTRLNLGVPKDFTTMPSRGLLRRGDGGATTADLKVLMEAERHEPKVPKATLRERLLLARSKNIINIPQRAEGGATLADLRLLIDAERHEPKVPKATLADLRLLGPEPQLPGLTLRERLMLARRERRWSGGRAAAYAQTLAQSGGTFDLAGHQPDRGFAVALANGPIIDPTDRLSFIRAYRQTMKSVQSGFAPYVGTWIDPDTGKMAIDPVTVVGSRAKAQRIGRMSRQKAYYDLLRDKNYPVHEAYGGNVLGLRGLAFGGFGKKTIDPDEQYKRRYDYFKRMAEGEGTPEERLSYLRQASQLSELFGREPISETSTEGGTKTSLAKMLQTWLRRERFPTTGQLAYGSDEGIAEGLKRLPKYIHESGMAQRFFERKAIRDAKQMSGPMAEAWMRGLGFDRQHAMPGSDDLSSLQNILGLPEWDQAKSIEHGFGFSKNAMGGAVKPISYGPGFAHAARGLEARALRVFGETHDIREAGYLTPSGKYLDFSGRAQAVGYVRKGNIFVPGGRYGDQRDYLAGQRSIDHREAARLFPRRARRYDSEAIDWMMDRGFIRVGGDYEGGISAELSRSTTPAQFARLVAEGRNAAHAYVDVSSKTGNRIASFETMWPSDPLGGRKMAAFLRSANELLARNRRAGGGPGGIKGAYIVNENGRELFVPKRLQDRIPADVMAQIGNRAKGGIAEIDQQPWSLFFPPEDGWIVPAHLKNRVPRAEEGASPGEEYEERQKRLKEAQRKAAEARRAQAASGTTPPVRPRAHLSPKIKSVGDLTEADYLKAATNVSSRDALIRAVATKSGNQIVELTKQGIEAGRVESAGAIQSALSGRTVPSFLSGTLGGLFGRRQALQASTRLGQARGELATFVQRERLFLTPEAMQVSQGIVKAAEAHREQLVQTRSALIEERKSLTKGSQAYTENVAKVKALDANILNATKSVGKANAEYQKIATVQAEHERLTKEVSAGEKAATPGFAARGGVFAGVIGANLLYGLGSALIDTIGKQVGPGLGRFVEQLSGFAATESRVTSALVDQFAQSGNRMSELFAGKGFELGLGTATTDFLQQTLGASVIAKKAAQQETGISDLTLAAVGSGRAPTGLYGSYGGLFGTGILAEALGGGRGLAEQTGELVGKLGTTITNGQPSTLSGADLLKTMPYLAAYTPRVGQANRTFTPTADEVQAAQKAEVALTHTIDDLNNNYQSGTRALYENTDGLKVVKDATKEQTDAMIEAAKATNDAAAVQAAQNFAGAGVAITGPGGQALQSADQFQKFWTNYAKGLTVLSAAQFLRMQETDRYTARLQSQIAQRFQTEIQLPYQLGQQFAAHPILPGSVGAQIQLPAAGGQATNFYGQGGTQFTANIRAQFAAAQSDLSELQKQSIEWIKNTTKFITANINETAGNEFAGYMDQVTASGQKIANAELTISKAQASLNFAQTSNNLRLAGRAVADALGLLGEKGGSRLGQIERQQTMLGFNLQQREINLNLAVAGFQNPGETPEERAARQEAAIAQAKIAQQQLNLSKAQFIESSRRALIDANATLDLLHQSQRVEATVLANQATIAAEQAKQQIAMSKADAIYTQAAANAQTDIGLLTSYVKQFGRESATADGIIQIFGQDLDKISQSIEQMLGINNGQALTIGQRERMYNEDINGNGVIGRATGDLFNTTGVTGPVIFGEAGQETVAILRNPRSGMMSDSPVGRTGGGPVVINININEPKVADPADITKLALTVRDEIDRALRLAGLR